MFQFKAYIDTALWTFNGLSTFNAHRRFTEKKIKYELD